MNETPLSVKQKLNLGSYELNLPSSSLPKPNDNDYRIGFIERYVVARVNMTEIIEVSSDVYGTVTNPMFKKARFKWKITGPLRNQYKGKTLEKEGVIDFNIRQLNDVNTAINGIKDVFDNPTQFYKQF